MKIVNLHARRSSLCGPYQWKNAYPIGKLARLIDKILFQASLSFANAIYWQSDCPQPTAPGLYLISIHNLPGVLYNPRENSFNSPSLCLLKHTLSNKPWTLPSITTRTTMYHAYPLSRSLSRYS